MTAAEPVYSTCSSTTQEEYGNTRHIGIDLHRNRFTCCVRLENGRNYLTRMEAGGPAAVREEAAAERRDGGGGDRATRGCSTTRWRRMWRGWWWWIRTSSG